MLENFSAHNKNHFLQSHCQYSFKKSFPDPLPPSGPDPEARASPQVPGDNLPLLHRDGAGNEDGLQDAALADGAAGDEEVVRTEQDSGGGGRAQQQDGQQGKGQVGFFLLKL